MGAKKKVKPLLVWSDPAAISKEINAAEAALPAAQKIVDAWNSIPDVPPLTPDEFKVLFDDYGNQQLIEKTIDDIYNRKFATSHDALGIGPENGKVLVADRFPNFEAFLATIYGFAGPSWAYALTDDTVIVSPDFIAGVNARNSIYFSNEKELEAKRLVQELVSSLNAMDGLNALSPYVFRTHNTTTDKFDFNMLGSFVEVRGTHPNFAPDPTQHIFSIKNDFYRKIKDAIAGVRHFAE